MACLKCFLLAVVMLLSAACAASARRLQQPAAQKQAEAPQLAAQAPILLGDRSERVISSASIRTRGGAVKHLGRAGLQRLRSAARFHGTVLDLAQHIESDDDLAVDAVNQALLFVCEGLAANASEISSGVAPSQQDLSISREQAFALSSRPSARFKIFLDFDGHTATGTNWNSAYGRDQIVSPPYDKDGVPSNFSPDELSDIIAIWRGVSEDYALFDVDVTTADPGAALNGNGIRVVIGGSWSDWYGRQAGGVAYVGSFTWTSNTPAYVWSQALGPNYAYYIMQAVSHEVGHTLGLWHDGTATSGYYQGQGDWAPIMGSSYYKPLTTFDKGEYAGANNQQDDLAVIGQTLPLLPQRFGSDAASATPLVASVDAATGLATAKAAGVVATAAGDWFSFTAAAGPATLSASVVAPWGSTNRANLDVQLTLTTAAGDLVAVLNPASLDVPATQVTLPAAGTYILAVKGVGSGDPAATGYSSYGSRGQYELTVVSWPVGASVPTPSPQPQLPSPSPAPVVVAPSPSPVPDVVVPSPFPSPAVLQPSLPFMRSASISMTRSWANNARTQLFCSVTVTIRDAAGNPLPGANVLGSWTLTSPTGTATAATAWTITGAPGTVAFRSSNMAPTAGSSCRFTVQGVELAGYQLDTTSTTGIAMTRALRW